MSREAYPKQFHRLAGQETLFQEACRRFSGPLFGDLFILANRHHRFLVAEQLEAIGLPAKGIVLEPVGRNTGPSAAIAALRAAQEGPDTLVLLAPSDHMIGDAGAFLRSIESGIAAAEARSLVIFGIKPDCPHTGYGYIQTDEVDGPWLKARRFVEKPSLQAAERFLDQGGFLWNSGLFLFKASTMTGLMEMHAPEILGACRKAFDTLTEDLVFHVLGEAFAEAPSRSTMPSPRGRPISSAPRSTRPGAIWGPGMPCGTS